MTYENASAPAVPTSGDTPEATVDAFLARATADPAVVGLVLSGSQPHEGLTTVHSDYDLHVILQDGRPSPLRELDHFRSTHLDLVVLSLTEFRHRGMPEGTDEWARYSYARAKVLLDRLDGGIADLLAQKRTLGAQEANRLVDRHLDAYINQLYRSVKSYRDNRPDLAHLDAAETIPFALSVIFGLHRRVRPYNKYLRWELTHHPLGDPRWDPDRLLPRVRRILSDGDPDTQRTLFADVERAAREAGHHEIPDSWGTDLELLRPGD